MDGIVHTAITVKNTTQSSNADHVHTSTPISNANSTADSTMIETEGVWARILL
jgi:hypothetical protein